MFLLTETDVAIDLATATAKLVFHADPEAIAAAKKANHAAAHEAHANAMKAKAKNARHGVQMAEEGLRQQRAHLVAQLGRTAGRLLAEIAALDLQASHLSALARSHP
jgi:hypothetical protein